MNSQVILLKISSNDSFISESKNRLIESKKRKKIFEISHLKIPFCRKQLRSLSIERCDSRKRETKSSIICPKNKMEAAILTLVNKFRNVGKRRLRRGSNTGYRNKKAWLGRVAILQSMPDDIHYVFRVNWFDGRLRWRPEARYHGFIHFVSFFHRLIVNGAIRCLETMRLPCNYFPRGLLSLYAEYFVYLFFLF